MWWMRCCLFIHTIRRCLVAFIADARFVVGRISSTQHTSRHTHQPNAICNQINCYQNISPSLFCCRVLVFYSLVAGRSYKIVIKMLCLERFFLLHRRSLLCRSAKLFSIEHIIDVFGYLHSHSRARTHTHHSRRIQICSHSRARRPLFFRAELLPLSRQFRLNKTKYTFFVVPPLAASACALGVIVRMCLHRPAASKLSYQRAQANTKKTYTKANVFKQARSCQPISDEICHHLSVSLTKCSTPLH